MYCIQYVVICYFFYKYTLFIIHFIWYIKNIMMDMIFNFLSQIHLNKFFHIKEQRFYYQ